MVTIQHAVAACCHQFYVYVSHQGSSAVLSSTVDWQQRERQYILLCWKQASFPFAAQEYPVLPKAELNELCILPVQLFTGSLWAVRNFMHYIIKKFPLFWYFLPNNIIQQQEPLLVMSSLNYASSYPVFSLKLQN